MWIASLGGRRSRSYGRCCAVGHGLAHVSSPSPSVCRSEFAERMHRHAQQLGAVLKAADFSFSVRPSAVANRQLDDLEILLGRAEQQIEVPEGVEVAEEAAIAGNLLVIPPKKNLRPTERIF